MGITDYNKSIIEEFRANKGIVGGPFEGGKLLLLHTIGAKSGEERINPLAYFEDGDDVLIVASYAGAPTNPPWYYNLLANQSVEIELGELTYTKTASVVAEPERTAIYEKIAAQAKAFAEYQAKTSRTIPIIRLSSK